MSRFRLAALVILARDTVKKDKRKKLTFQKMLEVVYLLHLCLAYNCLHFKKGSWSRLISAVKRNKITAPVAQLDRALVFGTRSRGFESLQARFYSPFLTSPKRNTIQLYNKN